MAMRHERWAEELIDVIEKHSRLPFDLGVSDCFIFPMDCVAAMIGEDPWAEIRGTYNTEQGAAKQLLAHGYKDVGEAFAAKFEEILPAFGQRGDLGVIDSPRGIAGVVFFNTGVIGKAEYGVLPSPRSFVKRAFKVGR